MVKVPNRALSIDWGGIAPPSDSAMQGFFQQVLWPEALFPAASFGSIGRCSVPHPDKPGLYLFKYTTFHGEHAYQPCSSNMRTNLLMLHPIGFPQDYAFELARAWSCTAQTLPTLPKAIRYMLVLIFDLTNELFQFPRDEDVFWNMRPWLSLLYDVTDILCHAHGLALESPETDWFLRPGQFPKDCSLRNPSSENARNPRPPKTLRFTANSVQYNL
jgi:hypothetical protein